jgi:MoaA/NifB/PqqE/SkfB family radical SAM enzyme
MRPVISWNLVGGCNYRCSYCVQKHAPGLGAPTDEELDAALDTLTALEGRWEVKLSGGEPFLLARLPQVAARLAQAGHLVSVLTNLSSPLRVLEDFIGAAQGQLRTFSCSLHREEVSEDAFLDKALAVKARLAAWPRASFVVNSVVVPGAVDLAAASFARFSRAGLKLYPQLMRRDGQPVAYGPEDQALLEGAFGALIGPAQMNRGSKLTGRLCHAGSRYFIIHPRGEVYACYPDKRVGAAALGNVFERRLQLWTHPRPCPHQVCPCAVPQNRGIIEGLEARASSSQ